MSKEFDLLSRLVRAVGDCEDTEAILEIAKEASELIKEGDQLAKYVAAKADLSRMICQAHAVLESAQDRLGAGDEGSASTLIDVAVSILAEHAEE